MTTAQLAAIKRQYPLSHLTWITDPSATALLRHNPYLDRVYQWTDTGRMIAAAQQYDLVLNADKSDYACAFVAGIRGEELRGFTFSTRGQTVPANPGSDYSFRLGLDDELKFRGNQRSGQSILAESWMLPYERDEYVLTLTDEEQDFIAAKRREWALDGRTVVAFNTGCSDLFPNKKLTVGQHLRLIELLAPREDIVLMLLGGREDTARNAEIEARAALPASRLIATPTTEGLRRGICYAALADAVVSGDTFGLHLSIALRKHVYAWFGLSCQAEIDLYGRGKKYFQPDLACSPCWKRQCPHNLECISGLDLDAIAADLSAFADSRLKEHH
jgi:heptosyltransferase-2